MTTPCAQLRDRHKLLLPIEGVMDTVSLSRRTVWRLVSAGEFPPPVKVGRASRWRMADITEWVDSLEVSK